MYLYVYIIYTYKYTYFIVYIIKYVHISHINLPLSFVSVEALLLSALVIFQADFCLSFTFDIHDVVDLESLLLLSESFINFISSVPSSVFCKSGLVDTVSLITDIEYCQQNKILK